METSKRGLAALAVVAATALVLVARATAESPPACAPDVQKFCQRVPAGGGRVLACLQEHYSQLSSDCQKDLEGMRHAVKRHAAHPGGGEWVAPCTADIQKLCSGIPAGAGRIAECLTEHQSALSEACKTAFVQRAK